MMANVELAHVFKKFGAVTAVNDLNLTIEDKEFMVLVGPSGCGKTTALRMVAGLEEISSGQVKIAGKVVNDVLPRDRDIAMVFQNYALYPHMSVYDNMAFGLSLRNTPKAEIERRVGATAQLLGLESLLKRKPRELSGGQSQRVALGRAIVREPQVFLMDEPLSNLDAKLRVQTRAEIIKLHRRLGITTIYVTHDQVEAMTMGTRIAVMQNGVLQQCDTPMEIYTRPSNMFVAGFIGTPSMNFLEATVQKSDDGYILRGSSFQLDPPPVSRVTLESYVGRKLVFGIRPADLFDTKFKLQFEPTQGNTLTSMVEVVEPMGDLTTVYAVIGTEQIVAAIDAETTVKDGDTLKLAVDLNRGHLFDPETQFALH
jgi:multiple sugar transport system ATP-binding protein